VSPPDAGVARPTRMRVEIAEQPDAVARTLDRLRPQVPALQRLAADRRQVLLLARGSSDNAAAYAQYACATRGGRLTTLGSPSLATTYAADVDLDGVLAVAVSQSGATEEIVDALAWASRCGAATLGVTNDPASPLATSADLALVTEAGEERAVPATKTYTTQLAALAVLAEALGGDDGRLARLDAVPGAMARALATAPEAERLAGRLADADRVVVTGRGFTASTAYELALKLTEACYVTAMGLPYGDLLHGPIAAVDAGTPALVAAAGDGPVLPEMTGLVRRLHETGAQVYGLGGDAAFAGVCDGGLPGPDLPEDLAPLALVVPGQLLVEALARVRGVDPDTPRRLTKVTQTQT
jgi:glutamine---fructose-6-phosphate transaminase (isomerizing)